MVWEFATTWQLTGTNKLEKFGGRCCCLGRYGAMWLSAISRQERCDSGRPMRREAGEGEIWLEVGG